MHLTDLGRQEQPISIVRAFFNNLLGLTKRKKKPVLGISSPDTFNISIQQVPY